MKLHERDSKLTALLDDEFLAKLLEVAKLSGWNIVCDFSEVEDWVKSLYDFMGKEIPDVEEYEIDFSEDD